MSEDIDYSAEEFLDWLCWMWAMDGDRFYPPDETAWECVESLTEVYEGAYDNDHTLTLRLLEAYQWELGQHARAYDEAKMKFDDAERWGFEPLERAARYHYEEVWTEDNAVEKIDWSWYTA